MTGPASDNDIFPCFASTGQSAPDSSPRAVRTRLGASTHQESLSEPWFGGTVLANRRACLGR